MDYAERTDGMKVKLGPHAPPGHPDYGNPGIGLNQAHLNKIIAYQNAILQRLEDWHLWQYMGRQGKMASEYRRLRRVDPEMDELVKLATISSNLKMAKGLPKAMEGQPKEIRDYPLPGTIYHKQLDVPTADWLITKEMKAVYTFFLKNTNMNPFKPDHPEWEAMKGMHPGEKKEWAKKHDIVTMLGERRKLHMAPQSGIPFTLAEDVSLPRHAPDLEVLRYDHSNPQHNVALRSDRGSMQLNAYDQIDGVTPPPAPKMVVVSAPTPEVTPEVKAKPKAKGKKKVAK